MIYLDIRDSTDDYMYYRSDDDYGNKLPNLTNEFVLTQSDEVIALCNEMGVQVNSLSSYLNLSQSLGIYEIFSYFFEGKLTSDFDMLSIIFKGLLLDSDYCFCFKLNATFCWFKVTSDKIVKLGKMQFSESMSKHTVGRFFKRLRFEIAKSGVALNKVKYLCWNRDDLDNEFSRYITKCDYLEDFFSKIDGLKGLSCANVFKLLSKKIHLQLNLTADLFVSGLMDSFQTLGIYEKDGILYSLNTYYKDYSSCVSSIIDWTNCTYGLIIDCEGKLGQDGSLNNGCRELGGLIFCKYKNVLLNLDTFSCDELLIEDTLLQVCENFKSIAGFSRNIKVLMFGKSDSSMLVASINNQCSKSARRNLLNRFEFVDCRKFIAKFVSNGDAKLDVIATGLDVLPVYPKHNPTNDARTLFNILAKILQDKDEFII